VTVISQKFQCKDKKMTTELFKAISKAVGGAAALCVLVANVYEVSIKAKS